ncbi:hypothetical protein FGB62_30g034 [Gracilaria domingensis]|nr:hypothetical protein FGB62_30g034 [Gracilaria domingensis]
MESIRKKYSPEDDLVDPGLLALDAIVESSARVKRQVQRAQGRRAGRHNSIKVSMPFVPTPPKYDAWIPVKSNYWVGKELNLEPYMPFLGDQDQDCELSFEVFEDMAGGADKEIDLSDGEVTKEGKFRMPKDDVERVDYYSLAQMRWREGSRKAILAVLHQFIKFDDTMWRVLAVALGIQDLSRIKAIAKVAQKRKREHTLRIERRKQQVQKLISHNRAWNERSGGELLEQEESNSGSGFMKHYCLICHMFACPQHESFNVEPIIAIPDKRSMDREKALKTNAAEACSNDCFLNKQLGAIDVDVEWSMDEIICMRECVPIFGLDPCSLALGVGSKSCRQVHEKLLDPLEADVARQELVKSRRTRRLDGRQSDAMDKDKSNEVIVEPYDPNSIDQDFSPCYHEGPCTQETCSCVKKGMHYGRHHMGRLSGRETRRGGGELPEPALWVRLRGRRVYQLALRVLGAQPGVHAGLLRLRLRDAAASYAALEAAVLQHAGEHRAAQAHVRGPVGRARVRAVRGRAVREGGPGGHVQRADDRHAAGGRDRLPVRRDGAHVHLQRDGVAGDRRRAAGQQGEVHQPHQVGRGGELRQPAGARARRRVRGAVLQARRGGGRGVPVRLPLHGRRAAVGAGRRRGARAGRAAQIAPLRRRRGARADGMQIASRNLPRQCARASAAAWRRARRAIGARAADFSRSAMPNRAPRRAGSRRARARFGTSHLRCSRDRSAPHALLRR